jgi:hypothetical protein
MKDATAVSIQRSKEDKRGVEIADARESGLDSNNAVTWKRG